MTRRIDSLASAYNVDLYQKLNRQMSFFDYVDAVYDKVSLSRSAYQRLYDCIMDKETVTYEKYRETLVHYKFFDPTPEDDVGVFGLDKNIMELVAAIRGAARWYGPERRLLLLHGPVGSAKSTICRKFKRGLESYSKTDAGEMFTFKWHDVPNDIYVRSEFVDPMHEDPLKLLPVEIRRKMQDELNEILISQAPNEKAKAHVAPVRLTGNLNPLSGFIWDCFMDKYKGDWKRILEDHVTVTRFVMDESTRKGIGTFQPKDEKNQDSTELTGDVNYQMLGMYGVDSDPRSFSFDGELQKANRGIMEFIEVLKLAKEFLYDLLGACQERQIKPKKFSQIDVDLVLVGHTNLPDFKKVEADNHMEALKDRTIRIDIPYLRTISEEEKVLEMEFNSKKIRQHIAPHTKHVTALATILSRLKPSKKGDVGLLDKAKLYDNKTLEGYNEDAVREMLNDHRDEGMSFGLSVRYAQNKFSNCLANPKHNYINGFMILKELEEGLATHPLIESEDQRRHYREAISLAKEEFEELIKTDVQDALTLGDNAMDTLLANYLDNVDAYVSKQKVYDRFTEREMEPDERLMRSIEAKADIIEEYAPEFRKSIQAQIGSLSRRNQRFDVKSNPKLEEALRMKLFEDARDSIKVSMNSIGSTSSVVEPHVKEKIDAVKCRLIKDYGYNEESATDTLKHVASIFARGDVKKKKK